MDDSLGLYISVPFCKAKCSFCNFASDVFAPARMDGYVDRICEELRGARQRTAEMKARMPERLASIYFGGGTPSLLEATHLGRIFEAIRGEFSVDAQAEVTLEAAPGQVVERTLDAALRCGINRVSFGVQSFVDRETAAVGRLHTGADCLVEIERMRRAGIERLSLDLIAGLPYQTEESWRDSVGQAVRSGVGHVSVYLMEIDEDSRLGREVLAGGARYHADALPADDDTAEWYGIACQQLGEAGLAQYEISNFARAGEESRHNLRYWEREAYLGVGLDAHSMLRVEDGAGGEAVRWANADDLDAYPEGASPEEASLRDSGSPLRVFAPREAIEIVRIGPVEAFEEELFLGLRLNAGIDLGRLGEVFGAERVDGARRVLAEVESAGLVERTETRVRLTERGRLVSNEVFSRLLVA